MGPLCSPRGNPDEWQREWEELTPEQRERLAKNLAEIGKALEAIVAPVVAQFRETIQPALQRWATRMQPILADGFARLQPLLERLFFPNWQGSRFTDIKLVMPMLLDEGLAVAWVPRARVLARLFAASDASARRRIIGAEWKAILADCVAVLEASPASRSPHARYALLAASALHAGHTEAGQALASNTLDTALRDFLSKEDFAEITSVKKPFNEDGYAFHALVVLAGVRGAYGEWWPARGDPVPRGFSRHASTHGVSARQYSRVNAVIALMHLTAVLRFTQKFGPAAIGEVGTDEPPQPDADDVREGRPRL